MLGYAYCFIAAVLSKNPEAKHFLSISLTSIAANLIPIRESRLWNVSGVTRAGQSLTSFTLTVISMRT
jgi:hypothetical protein